MSAPIRESLLVFSDVHLGSDLNDSGPFVPRSATVDRDLAELIAHYRKAKPPTDRWRVVIAGDFIDFVGMSVDPKDGEELETELTSEERRNGVGSAEDHARLKLRRVAKRHREIFVELGALVAAGHAVTVLHGNHDIELHWDGVKADFRDLLAAGVSASERAAFDERIEFRPWFFYREGVVYIEHGHQYDPFCSTRYVLAPLSPRDPRRVERGVSETMLRAIVRRTPGLREHGHEDRGLTSYIGWGLTLGVRGTVGLITRFALTVAELLRMQRAYASESGSEIRARHDREVAEHAASSGVPEDRLREALGLHCPPIGATFAGVLASVMLDRMAIFCVVLFLLSGIALGTRLGPLAGYGWYATGVVLAVWVALHVLFSRARSPVDPASLMRERARDLARLFPAPFVVMGHTHTPLAERVGAATYINAGGWAEEEPEAGVARPYRSPRTHVVIHEHESGAEALLYEWHPEEGPRRHAACPASSVPRLAEAAEAA